MKKSVASHVIIMVIAVILAGLLGAKLNKMQTNQDPSKSFTSTAPIGGFHKIASDLEWMLFIQYLGGLKSVNKDNADEVIRRLEKIVSYDPNFEKAYQVGVMSLSIENPEKAVAILDTACQNPQLKDKWKLPFYAGFILTHSTMKDKDEAVKQQKFEKAVGYYKEAIKRSATPEPYVVNSYLRALAKAKGIKNDKLAMLEVLLKEWKSSSDAREMETSIIPNIPQRILKAAQEARKEYPNDKEVLEATSKAINKVFKDQHICMKCLTPYAPGDKYCSCCGEKVEVYGICPVCKSVLKGKFCYNCGAAAKAKKKAAAAPKAKKPQAAVKAK